MTTWGEFVIQEEIGRGSFGGVYKAFHPTLRQPVALKLIPVMAGDTREIERALDESRRLASVRHHNVVTVHDARYADGHVGICMELVAGASLAQVVERQGRLGPDEVSASAITLCNALSAIHAAHIVHNDVKAQNVVREDGGRLVLMDFGAGRRLREPDRTTGLYFAGTPVYMAPEVFTFHEPSPASDIYSLGVLLFYLLTATYPVQGRTLEEIAQAHSQGRRRYLGDLRSDLPERLLAVIDRALEPRPSDRYKSTGEMLHELTSGNSRRHVRVEAPETLVERRAAPRGDADTRGVPSTDWLKRLPAAVAALVALVWMIGFLASRAHRVMFGVPSEFDVDSPLDWLVVGFQTLPLPIYSMLMALTAYLAVSFLWRIVTRVSPAASAWSRTASTRLATASGRAGLDEPDMVPTLVLIAQVALLVGLYATFHDFFAALTSPLVVDGPVPAHAALHPHATWIRYCVTTSMLALGGILTWHALVRRRRPGQRGFAAHAAGFAVTAVFVGMATVPWRVVYGAEFPVTTFDSERCYVIEARVADSSLLLCPWRTAGRSIVVRKSDPSLTQLLPQENIYSAIAARLRSPGGP